MTGIPEHEKLQLLAVLAKPGDAARPPAALVLSMTEDLRQLEQWARLLPQSPRPPARGDNWLL